MITDQQLSDALLVAHETGLQDRNRGNDCVFDSGVNAARAINALHTRGEREVESRAPLSTADLADLRDYRDIQRYYRHGYAAIPIDRIRPLTD